MGRRLGQRKRIPLLRYSAKDAFEHFKQGGVIQVMKNGTAELWDADNAAVGYVTKRSHELLLDLIDARK